GADEVHNNFIGFQGLALPVPRDVAEQPVFDLIPLAGPGWEMADFDRQPGLVAQPLQFGLPKAIPTAVAAATVGGDQQPRRLSITPAPQALPPAADRGHGELRRVAADADPDPRLIVTQVVDPIRHRLSSARVGEVMGIDLPRLPFG